MFVVTLLKISSIQFISVQSLSHVRLFATPWITACQASLSITNSRNPLRLTSIESVMPSSLLILSSDSFPMSQLFAWGGQSTGVSALASFLPKNTQDQSPLEWTGWISLQSKGLSKVFSNMTVQKHQFFGTKYISGILFNSGTHVSCNALTVTLHSVSDSERMTSLLVQWLRLYASSAGSPGLIPCQGTRSYMPQLRVCRP